MAEMFLNWVADTFARSDIIDLYFIISDLVDIPISDAELCETAYYDSLATSIAGEEYHESVPLGKLVL